MPPITSSLGSSCVNDEKRENAWRVVENRPASKAGYRLSIVPGVQRTRGNSAWDGRPSVPREG